MKMTIYMPHPRDRYQFSSITLLPSNLPDAKALLISLNYCTLTWDSIENNKSVCIILYVLPHIKLFITVYFNSLQSLGLHVTHKQSMGLPNFINPIYEN